MSLSTVLSDMKGQGMTTVGSACILTSRGVTSGKIAEFFSIEDPSTTAFGTGAGLCIALRPLSAVEAASSVLACSGRIVYFADDDDISRGEGLFDTLAPAIEYIMNDGMESTSKLIVVSSNPSLAKTRLEEGAAEFLGNLVSEKKLSTLEGAFSSIEYVTSAESAMGLISVSDKVEQAEVAVATATSSSPRRDTSMLSFSSSMSAKDMAAAWTLEPAGQKVMNQALETVKATSDDRLVDNFGELAIAARVQGIQQLQETSTPSLSSSTVGRQIYSNFKQQMTAKLAEIGDSQLDQLKDVCFDEFKQNLSKLRISPLLAQDMQREVTNAAADFAKRAKKMTGNVGGVKTTLKAQMQEYCDDRLVAAKASGQFRPAPKKAISFALHWLFPQPFGNDVRQEPWDLRDSEGLIHIPQNKISDVNPDEVKKGSWRDAIIPSPSGNLMTYLPDRI